MKVLIESLVKKTIEKKFPSEVIRNFLLAHPIKEKMVDNLLREIKGSDRVLSGMSGDLQKKRDSIEELVEGVTLLFAKTAIEQKERELRETMNRGNDAA